MTRLQQTTNRKIADHFKRLLDAGHEKPKALLMTAVKFGYSQSGMRRNLKKQKLY